MNPDKFYLVDTGLARAVSPKSDESNGWLLGNLVYLAPCRGDNRIEYYNTKKGDELKVSDCTVVTWDAEGESDGIRIVPAWKWSFEE